MITFRSQLLLVIAVVAIYTVVSTLIRGIPRILAEPNRVRSSRRLCANPFLSSVSTPLSLVQSRMQSWLDNVVEKEKHALAEFTIGTHSRFGVFENVSECEHTCVGGKCSSDASKVVCGISKLAKPCVIYSIGGNNEWSFELDLVEKTPCDIHTFDCTGSESRFQVPDHPRINFHYTCLVPEGTKDFSSEGSGSFMTLQQIQSMLGHRRVDILKMYIEGYEWPILLQWYTTFDVRAPSLHLPMQILVEIHYKTQMNALATSRTSDFKFPTDMITLKKHLTDMGYFSTVYDLNPQCRHCLELTLLRMWCPAA